MDQFAAAQKIKSRVTCTIAATSGVSRVVVSCRPRPRRRRRRINREEL